VIQIKPTEEENILLKNYLKTSPLILIRYKCSALLMRSKGMKLADIGDIVSRDITTISRWFKDWDNRHMASIFSGHKDNNNASKLTKEQKKQIKETLRKPPSEYALTKEFWDVPTLKKYIRVTFDIIYESVQSYHFLLAFSNLSFKYPDTFDRRRDDVHIAKRMEEIREEIKPFLIDNAWEVFASDEVRIQLEAITRRAWLKRGERTIVKVNRKQESQSYIGFLNQKSFDCHIYEMAWQNQQEVLKAFKLFLKKYPDKKICIIWDNASFHKGVEIKNALKEGGLLERVHLIALPPYAPDNNPIERVWNNAKGASANIQYDTFQETKLAFVNRIRKRKFKYQI
jgi:transposase